MSEFQIINEIEQNQVLAVVRHDDYKKEADIAKAIIEGGIRTIEITLECDNCFKAIQEISKIEGVSVAAGSIVTTQQAQQAYEAGAKLLVSPVLEMSVIKFCKWRKIPLIVGASTANEAYNAWKMGAQMVKIFPAHALGGPEYIRDILKPMPFLRLMPTSGVQVDDFKDYLDAGAVAVGMGKSLYKNTSDLNSITDNAKQVAQKLNLV